VPAVGEAIDSTQFLVNRFSEGKRIQAGAELLQSADLSGITGS
jgi:hypothetical protein